MPITLQTIASIELTNACNLKCTYCVNRLMPDNGRKYQILSDFHFDHTINVLSELCNRGTQQEVSMQGNGESFLDPQLFKRIARVKYILGSNRLVFMCSNGEILAGKDGEELAIKLKASGLDRCDLSIHRPDWARKAIQNLYKAGIPCIVNPGAITSPHNWAGQLPEEEQVPITVQGVPCDPIAEGRGYVQSYGGVSPCCYDYRGWGSIGNIDDDKILDRQS